LKNMFFKQLIYLHFATKVSLYLWNLSKILYLLTIFTFSFWTQMTIQFANLLFANWHLTMWHFTNWQFGSANPTIRQLDISPTHQWQL
jgi:hypothetical protein